MAFYFNKNYYLRRSRIIMAFQFFSGIPIEKTGLLQNIFTSLIKRRWRSVGSR